MRVVIAGGHGQIALELTKILAERGDEAVGLIRNPAHDAEIRAAGGNSAVLDLEKSTVDDVARVLDGADATVFAAGAGPGSGVERKDTVDRGAAVLLADAAEHASVRRYLQVSATRLDRLDDPDLDEVFAAYLRAKKAAEEDLRARSLDWTILRPGKLTGDPGTGQVRLAESVESGEVPRADVAAVLAALLNGDGAVRSSRRTLELIGGDTPVAQAVATL